MGDAFPGGPFTIPPWTVVSKERSGWGVGERASAKPGLWLLVHLSLLSAWTTAGNGGAPCRRAWGDAGAVLSSQLPQVLAEEGRGVTGLSVRPLVSTQMRKRCFSLLAIV